MPELEVSYAYQSDGSIVLTSSDSSLDNKPFLVHINKRTPTWSTLSGILNDKNGGSVPTWSYDYLGPRVLVFVPYDTGAHLEYTDLNTIVRSNRFNAVRIGKDANQEDVILDMRQPIHHGKSPITVISGPAGSGKTSLLRLIAANTMLSIRRDYETTEGDVHLNIIDELNSGDYDGNLPWCLDNPLDYSGKTVNIARNWKEASALLMSIVSVMRHTPADKTPFNVIIIDGLPLIGDSSSSITSDDYASYHDVMVSALDDILMTHNNTGTYVFMATREPNADDSLTQLLFDQSYYRISCGHDSYANIERTMGEAPKYNVSKSLKGRAVIKMPGDNQREFQVGFLNPDRPV